MTPLQAILQSYCKTAVTEREKGTYFEELVLCYLRNEASYRDLYSQVWTYADWAQEQGIDKRDTGIDLVAQTSGTGEYHAIQCKLYAEGYTLKKSDIDSFFTASGKKPFTHRLIVSTTNLWSEHAEDALRDQQPPVSKIDLNDLENSQIDWERYRPQAAPVLKKKKQLREHQRRAHSAVLNGFREADRGKLIMACGTGKTFTSLKIAEALAGKGKRVLFLVPSLALLSQTLTEWTQESTTPLHSLAVCSDSDVGKKRKKDDDIVQTFTHELRYPATTDPARLAEEMTQRHDAQHMSVIFSTYHSIDVLNQAQQRHELAAFDLIICDEAHRTTGATFADEDESNFVKVHNADYLKGAKRLYMTATPRIYGNVAKAAAEKGNVTLCSMDDEALYGKELHVLTFSESVKRGLLVDYKVLVLAVEEKHVSRRLQNLLKDDNNQLVVDDAAKIIGCWKALSKQGVTDDLEGDSDPMRRAVAFCQVIEPSKARTHKVSSKSIAAMFQAVVEAYQASETDDSEPSTQLTCEAEHVDGGMNASEKEAKLTWLKEETPPNTCRILSNVRCLSEGVDVPALDSVLFLTPRNSQVDVVQSVGRVMRMAPGKKRGYVILPVVIPAGMESHEALNDNKVYAVVWQVLQALRSHDDRFDAMINKLDLIGKDVSKMEVIAVTDKIQKKRDKEQKPKVPGLRGRTIGRLPKHGRQPDQYELEFEVSEIERAIYAKLVQKCGNRHHWEEWANDIAKIAKTHIDRINGILENEANTKEREAFQSFAAELRDDLNDSITDSEVIKMLAQHLITKPVFEALFEGYSFAQNNPISLAMQGVLDLLNEHRLDKESATLESFYASVKLRAEGIDSAAGKQKIIVELYDKFFRKSFKEMTDRLGIVYTPIEVVDFIIHSVNDVLQSEFGQTLGSKGVHIIDPFTGTGTFITRLLQSGLIAPEELPHKYKHEIHANEIVLLAYYIAAINIEATYHDLMGGEYQSFEGICLTDTFQLSEKDDLISYRLEDNSNRRSKQKKLDIRVIVGNPPYSSGQKDDNDNAANVKYPSLDGSIQQTYVKASSGNPRSLYDSYIRAFRWASNRIEKSGIICYVSNAGYLKGKAADGFRKCLAEEFSSIYVFHLRGDQRTLGEISRKEGGKIFGSGSRAPIAITMLVKNPGAKRAAQIHYCDIGDYLTREEKLSTVAEFGSITGISNANRWQAISPDRHGDWISQRDSAFESFISIGDKKNKNNSTLFSVYSSGVKTNRDCWAYNASHDVLQANMLRMVQFYNHCLKDPNEPAINNTSHIGWSWVLRERFKKQQAGTFKPNRIGQAVYRPYEKTWLYYDGFFNENRYMMPRIFPSTTVENLMIVVKQRWAGHGHLALITNRIIDIQTDGGVQCFPLYAYDDPTPMSAEPPRQASLLGAAPRPAKAERTRRDAITDEGLTHFKTAYPGEAISKEDIFYYVYGLLHSEDYRERYADNLAKELPRIPCVKNATDFWAFSKAGRALAELHLNYETVKPYPLQIQGGSAGLTDADYRVEKMRYGKNGKDKDLTTLIYNHKITLAGIPSEAYEYVVNGKPALDWVVERQCVKTDKASGIVNDANDWAIETMKNPRYPLELFARVVTVSLETMKIVKSLPKLNI